MSLVMNNPAMPNSATDSTLIDNTLDATAALYRRIERRVSALKQAGPFSSSMRSEYHRRAEEIRALYRSLRSLEASQAGVQEWTYRSSQ
jgi:hypothetical protein